MSKPKYVIFDLDGCISDDRHRRHFLDSPGLGPDWDTYHSKLDKDVMAHAGMLHTISSFIPEVKIVIFTARPGKYRQATSEWLRKCGVIACIDELRMRSDIDKRPSPVVKEEMLIDLLERGDVLCAFDDRVDVLEMYRANGVTARSLVVSADSSLDDSHLDEISAAAKQAPPEPIWHTHEMRAPDFLEHGAATFRERNAIYGDNYLAFGRIMDEMFPDGLHIEKGDVDSYNRLGIFVQCTAKLSRYAGNLTKGGHKDSAHDLMVYGSMLEEVTDA